MSTETAARTPIPSARAVPTTGVRLKDKVALITGSAQGIGYAAAVKATLDKFGKIDILVNNAGIAKDTLLLRMSEADWDQVLDVMGDPADVARAVLFLSSDESSYITGHVLNVNGGGYM